MARLDRPYLGVLEVAVMEALWGGGCAGAKSLHATLGRRRGISLSTLQSALEPLHRKRLVNREKVSHAYRYTPAVARVERLGHAFETLMAHLAKDETESVLAAFVDFASRTDDASLDALERLIAEQWARRHEEPD